MKLVKITALTLFILVVLTIPLFFEIDAPLNEEKTPKSSGISGKIQIVGDQGWIDFYNDYIYFI